MWKNNLDGWNPNPIHFITYPITFHQSKHLHPSKQTINNPNRKTCKKKAGIRSRGNEMAYILVVTRASVAQVLLCLIFCVSQFPMIWRCCAFNGRWRYRRQRGVCDDFVNLENVSSQASKMLLGVEFACVRS